MAFRRSILTTLVGVACATLSSCTVGPDFAPPDPGLPGGSFMGEPPPPPDPQWWRAFGDPMLDDLERRVVEANLDVQTATIRLAESRFQRDVAASAELPSVTGNGKYQRELYSQNGIASLISKLAPTQNATGTLQIPPISDYTVSFDASWELDLWGHVRRQVESADAQSEQSAEQRRDTLVSTLAELARDYIQLRGVQTQIKISSEALRVDQDIARLAEERQKKGVQNGVDTENAIAQIESVRAQLPTLAAQETQSINAIGFLLDRPPEALRQELGAPKAIPLAPPRIALGVPSELARRRPDVRAAEAQLHAATAEIGVAVASFFPTVKLNGTVGLDALDLKKLFKASSLQYMAGPTITVPIFAGGQLKSTLELRKAQQIEAAIAYQKTVLQAWHEVVNALAAYRKEQERRSRLKLQVAHSHRAFSLAHERYRDGVGEFLWVLDAERTLLQAEQQYATSTTNAALNLVQLYKALGGGWEGGYPETPASREALLDVVR
jgi:NodT family efflux transporter outer membrane factor (OMF) lipoprotein